MLSLSRCLSFPGLIIPSLSFPPLFLVHDFIIRFTEKINSLDKNRLHCLSSHSVLSFSGKMGPFPAQFISSVVCWDSHYLWASKAQHDTIFLLPFARPPCNWILHLQWWMCCSFLSTFDLTCDYLDIIFFLPVTSHVMSCFHSIISLSSASSLKLHICHHLTNTE